MTLRAASFFSEEPDSEDAGRLVARGMRDAFGGEQLQVAMVYATVNHDQAVLLEAVRRELGPGVPLLGCSVQGLACNEEVLEEGLVVGIMGFGGTDLRCATAAEHDIGTDARESGSKLVKQLKEKLGREPKLIVLMYDPLCGADIEALLGGMRRETACPVIGGAAGQPWGRPICTFQYFEQDVFSKGAVALGLSGPFDAEIGVCHGTVPTGVSITVTKTEGPRILEIDGRKATDVWCEHTGLSPSASLHQGFVASWAIAVERRYQISGPHGPSEKVEKMIRGAFGLDFNEGSIVVQAAVPEGSRVMFHHRAVDQVLEGTKTMGADLAARLQGKTPWAVLGFECAARTFPFLGPLNTKQEHLTLRRTIAPATPWLGMMAWGEVAPLGGESAFHNYTYPIVVLTR